MMAREIDRAGPGLRPGMMARERETSGVGDGGAADRDFFPIGGRWMLLRISHDLGCRYYPGDRDARGEQFVPRSHGRMNFRRAGQGLFGRWWDPEAAKDTVREGALAEIEADGGQAARSGRLQEPDRGALTPRARAAGPPIDNRKSPAGFVAGVRDTHKAQDILTKYVLRSMRGRDAISGPADRRRRRPRRPLSSVRADPAPRGPPMPIYLCEYAHRGASYSLDVPADSFEDAEARVASIRAGLRVAGELEGRIPVEPGPLMLGLPGRRPPAS
jgi:hypothetical protein